MIRALVLGLAMATASAGALVAQQASAGSGAVLRLLDKTNGETRDLDLLAGTTREIGRLRIRMTECRITGSDEFVGLEIFYGEAPEPLFSGWMVGSSPALNPMNHPRYDVWLLRCKR